MSEPEPTQPTKACQLREWGRERGFPITVMMLRGAWIDIEGDAQWGAFTILATEEEIARVLDACVLSEMEGPQWP